MSVSHAASLLVAMTVIPAANRWALARGVPADQHQHWWRAMTQFGMRLTDRPAARLGWIGGTVRAIEPAPGLKVPHMGWNDVTVHGAHPVVETGEAYFLHGYHFDAAEPMHVLATTDHGGPRVAAVAKDNILGVQFHPEKSQSYGIATLARFLEWNP